MTSAEIVGLVISVIAIVSTVIISLYIFQRQFKQSDKQHEERMRQLEIQLKEVKNQWLKETILFGHNCKCEHCLKELKIGISKNYMTQEDMLLHNRYNEGDAVGGDDKKAKKPK